MFPNGIQIFIGIEQSEGNGYEPIGSFITGTPAFRTACQQARIRADELNQEYADEGDWYAFVADEYGRKEIL
ncbi:MAG: hypothetical protein AB1489_09830 [Acidobacteriota bacterium]